MTRLVQVSVLALSVALSSCQTLQNAENNPKQTGGMLLGAALGGLLGSQFGGGTGKVVATALGVVAGGWLGSEIGKSLDRADRAAIDQKSAQALSSARDGETITWNNPDSGASARITPASTKVERREVPLVRRKDVAPIPPLELIGQTYKARRNANVRAAPTTDAATTTRLRAGETFQAVGKVQGKDWIVVGQNNRTVGYVHASLVQKAAPPSMAAGTSQGQAAVRPAVNLDHIKDSKAVDLDAEGLVADNVVATSECRTMNVEVSNKEGQSEQNKFKACKGTDGAWEIM